MYSAIGDVLKVRVANLDFVETSAGLVTPTEDTQEITEGVYKKIIYPVTCGMGADCFVSGKYMAVTPDSKKKGLVYWEGRSDFVYKEGLNKNTIFVYEGKIRQVGWFNLQALGLDTFCSYEAYFASKAIEEVIGKHVLPLPYDKSGFELNSPRLIQRKQSIFEEYTYSKNVNLLMYPFDCFAIDWDVRLYLNISCMEALDVSTPLNCIVL